MCRLTNLAVALYLTTLVSNQLNRKSCVVTCGILRSRRGSTVSRAERACAALLPTAPLCVYNLCPLWPCILGTAMDERVEALCEEVANLSNLLPDDVFALKLDETYRGAGRHLLRLIERRKDEIRRRRVLKSQPLNHKSGRE